MVLPFLLNKNLMPVLCNNFLRNKNLVEDIEQIFENIKISEMIHQKDRQSSGQLISTLSSLAISKALLDRHL